MLLIDAKNYDFRHVIITLLSSCLTKPVHPFPFMQQCGMLLPATSIPM